MERRAAGERIRGITGREGVPCVVDESRRRDGDVTEAAAALLLRCPDTERVVWFDRMLRALNEGVGEDESFSHRRIGTENRLRLTSTFRASGFFCLEEARRVELAVD